MTIKQHFQRRKSGQLNESIKHLENALDAAHIIRTKFSLDDCGAWWLEWFENCLLKSKNELKIYKYIPASFGGIWLARLMKVDKLSLYDNLISNTVNYNDGKLHFKDIVLPIPDNEHSKEYFVSYIVDSLLPYLLHNVTQSYLYPIYEGLEPLWLAEGPYEYGNVFLEKGDIVIDAGAFLGEFSALASAKDCKAYAFEPLPQMIESCLSKTAEWNKNIEICQYAFSDKKGKLTLSFADMETSVNVIDLDSFVHENNLPRVDFIKADIEGAERHMLKGAKGVLKEFAPKIAICTYHLPDDPKVLRELILDANPNYVIEERFKKMYAHIPQKSTFTAK